MQLNDLPNELIFLVARCLPQKSLASLLQTSHGFYELLQKTLYDNTPKSETNRILIWACEHGRTDLAREMLKRGGVDEQPKYGPRPLAIAAVYGHVEVVKLLLDQEGIDPNEASFATLTALMYASSKGNLEVVKILLANDKVRPHQSDESGRTPFIFAAENGHVSVMKELLETGKIKLTNCYYGRSAIHYAANMGREEAISFLLTLPGADPDFRDREGSTPLAIAAEAGASSVVQVLLETGRVDVNARDSESRTPLHQIFGKNAKTRFFVRESELVEERKEIIRRMLAGEDITQCVSALDIQIERANEQKVTGNGYGVIRQLIALPDIDLDPRDSEGRTPLSYAAGRHSIEGARLLIATGKVDLESQDNDGWSPITWLERQSKDPPTEDESDEEGCRGNYFSD